MLAYDINKGNSDPQAKSNINVANSLLALVDGMICPKSEGEEKGLTR